jgi:hypothetical protein
MELEAAAGDDDKRPTRPAPKVGEMELEAAAGDDNERPTRPASEVGEMELEAAAGDDDDRKYEEYGAVPMDSVRPDAEAVSAGIFS